MQTALECFPCFLRQALAAARRATNDAALHRAVIDRVAGEMRRFDTRLSPPAMAQRIHRVIRDETGEADPYRDIKQHFNRHGMRLRDRLRSRVRRAPDPFAAAVRLAIAGNSIDFGTRDDVTEHAISRLIRDAWRQPVRGSVTGLRRAVWRARRILFLADNAGEIALDQLLLEQMPLDRVVVAVRGRPVLNDATHEDAEAVGLTSLVEVIDNGSDAPGTILDTCSPRFRRTFAEADLVVAKGQGNFESLSSVPDRDIRFLFMVKCPLVARQLHCRVGAFVVRAAGRPPPSTRRP